MHLHARSGSGLRPGLSSRTPLQLAGVRRCRLLTTLPVPQSAGCSLAAQHCLREPARLFTVVTSASRPAGPSEPQQPSSLSEQLNPVLYRFVDNAPAGSSSSNGLTGTPRPVTSAGLAPPAVTYTAPASSSGRPNTASSGGAYVPAQSDGHSTTQPKSTNGTSAGSNGSTLAGSYSDYYRSKNTVYQPASSSLPATRTASTQTADLKNALGQPGASQSTSTGLPSGTDRQLSANSGQEAVLADGHPAPDASGNPAETSVSDALARAQAALAKAESSLDDIQKLQEEADAAGGASRSSIPGFVPPGMAERWTSLVSLTRKLFMVGVLVVGMLTSHACGLAVQWAGAVVGALGMAGWGYRKKSLAMSGAAAAFVVGCGTLGSSLRFGATLIAFFLSSSWLTQYKEEMKEGLEEGGKKGGQRSWVQVLCNGGIPVALAVTYGILAGCVDLPLGPQPAPNVEPWRAQLLTASMGGFLGYMACCCGDTWASELGPLSSDTPRLITTLRPVRRGTNGGVTLLGLSASILGGMFVGLVFYVAGLASPTLWIFEQQRALAMSQWKLIPLGLMAGLFGSALDSLLGATVQYTGYDRATGRIVGKPGPDVTHIAGHRLLDNNAVNFASASVTAALTALAAMRIFGV